MDIRINAQGFGVTAAIRAYAERRLRFALPLEHPAVRGVVLTLTDVNGPRGGVDKRCRIQVRLAGRAPRMIEETRGDAYVAIDRASERMAISLYRMIERTKERRRSSQPGLVEHAVSWRAE